MVEQHAPGSLRLTMRNYALPLAVVALGTLLSIALFMVALSSETASLQREFESIARLKASAIDNRIRLLDEKTRSVRSFVRVTSDPEGLRTYLGVAMLDRVGFELIGWLPDADSGKSPIVVAATDAALGKLAPDDIASMAEVREAYAEAVDSKAVTLSLPYRLEPGQVSPYVAILAPLSEEVPVGGSVISVFDTAYVLDATDDPSSMETIYLFDSLAPEAPVHVAGYAQPGFDRTPKGIDETTARAAFSHVSPLPSTNGRWQVVFLPAPAYVLSAIGFWTWATLAAGLIITALIGFAMFQQARQGVTVSAQVEARTRALRIAANHLNAVFDTVVDGLITIDDRAIVKGFNASAERIFGYHADEVIGQNVKMLMPEPYHGEHDTYLTNYLRGGEAKIIGIGREVAARRKDGSVFPMELGVSVFDSGFGRSFVGIVRDISERKVAQEALKDSRERTQSIIDHAMDGVICIDRDSVVTEWNAQAEALLGWTSAEAVGQPLTNLMIPPEYRDPHRQGMRRLLSDGVGPILNQRLELPALTKSRGRITIELSVTALKLRDVWTFTAFVRDISARKAAEAERDKLIGDLKRSNQELDDFAYIASHDLKEPLRGLFNNAKFLQEDYGEHLDSEGVRRLDRLGFLSQRMERLVNDLLYFSRLGRQELAIQHTDLNLILSEIAAMIETTLKEENAEILVPQALPGIVCDRPRITEVFRNLIVNGIKYNDKPRKIVEIGYLDAVKTDEGDITDAFYVRDNGIGIEREFHTEIFRIFKRLNEESDAKRGTGVGLTFVKKIIERHGGRIWLESTPGRGTTFYFTIKRGMANVQAA
jgi:two-component system, LuxR family, sensor kinase FixL